MLPKVILDIIRDYVVSLMFFETRQKVTQALKKRYVLAHLNAVHQTTLDDNGEFSYKYCLEVVTFMNKNNIGI